MNRYIRNLIIIFSLFSSPVVGQPTIGHAFLDAFQGKCGALEKSQIWQITSGINDYLFFASNNGLGIYDGVRWEVIPSKEFLIIRSLYYDASTKILFSGAVNQFGRWEMGSDGMFEYTPLWKNTKSNSTIDFWKAASPDSNNIYFQAHQLIIKYNIPAQTFISIYPQQSFRHLSVTGKRVFVQDGNTLCEIDSNNNLTPITDVTDRIMSINQESNGALVIFLEHQGAFYLSDSSKLIPINIKTNTVLNKYKIFSCHAVNDQFFIGTTQNGLYVLDSACTILQNVSEAAMLPSTTVLSAYIDKENNIWMGLDEGVAVLYQGRSERFFSPSPAIGNIHNIVKVNNQVFIGTNTGLYEMHSGGECTLIEGTTGPVWSMHNIAGKLVYTHDLGVFSLERNIPECIHSEGATSLIQINPDSDDYISSDYYGLSYYKLIKGKLTYIAKIRNYEENVRRLQIDKYGYLWAIIPRKGFLRIQLSDDKLTVTNTKMYYTPLETTPYLLISILDGNLIFSNGEMPFRYDIRLDSLVEDRYASSIFQLCGPNLTNFSQFKNLFWYQSPNDIGYVTRDGGHPEKYSGIFSNIYNKRIEPNISKLDNNVYVIGYQNGISYYQLNKYVQNHLQIRIVKAYGAGDPIYHNRKEPYFELPFNKHNISIYPTHLNPDRLIEYRIPELDTIWKTERIEDVLTITWLESGKYTVQLRNKGDFESPSQELFVIVDRLWLLSSWMIFVYVLCFMGILLLIFLYFKRKTAKEKLRLEQSKLKKLEELENINLKQKQHISELEKEKLKIELREKDKQLAIITMNDAKRNNFLIDLKNNISSLQSGEGASNGMLIKQAVKKIDSELNSKEGWALFEQYFDSIFDGLLDRLAAKYPQLTQSDLRLCAYLKLNLSNKEIAGLLNISYRSVEMAKYRLRKKLDLEPNDNFSSLLSEVSASKKLN